MPVALITGANRGLGLAFARAYVARGWQVIASARRPEGAGLLLELASQADGRLRVETLDIANFSAIETLAERLSNQPIDVLINNAALTGGPLGSFGHVDYARWGEAFRINAMAPMKMMECFADAVAASGRKVIFNLSSRIGANPFFGYLEYFSSKSALNMVVKQASIALEPRGVIVVAAHPGWVGTEATAAQGKAPLTPEAAAAFLIKIIDELTVAQTGSFFDPDGSTLPLVTQQHEIKFYSKPRTATA
ncbi:MAG: SDR family oxidoreductase [Steroidobacteraceae bacterium]|mgnify:CR=1 FL=1